MMDTLTLYEIFAFFLIYSFLGWCMEVVFHAIRKGEIVNRGFLNGACCPIYGVGMVAVLTFLLPLSDNIIVLYVGGTIVCTLLELVTGWVLFRIFHMRWWDYSNQPCNLGGYICLRFSLLWGVACVFVVKVIHPVVLTLLDLIPHIVGIWLMIFMYILFAADCIATVMTVTHMNRDLKTLDKITADLKENSDKLTQELATHAMEGEEKAEEMKEEREEEKGSRQAELQNRKKELENSAEELRNKMLKNRVFGTRRLLKAFPDMSHDQYNDALDQLKEHSKKNDNKTKN